jgi:hypothetical protein
MLRELARLLRQQNEELQQVKNPMKTVARREMELVDAYPALDKRVLIR